MTYAPKIENAGDGIWRIGFNRPDKRNSLDPVVTEGLRGALAAARASDDCRAVILEGDERAFCAGADFDALTSRPDDLIGSFDYSEAALAALAHDLRTLPKPTIAALRGGCYGAGVQMAAACDIRLAADDLTFAVPAVKLHLIYPIDALDDLIKLAGPGAVKRLIFTADPLGAEECLTLGFVDQVVPVAQFETALIDMAKKIAATPTLVTGAYKEIIDALADGASQNSVREVRDETNRAGPMEKRLAAIAAERAAKRK